MSWPTLILISEVLWAIVLVILVGNWADVAKKKSEDKRTIFHRQTEEERAAELER